MLHDPAPDSRRRGDRFQAQIRKGAEVAFVLLPPHRLYHEMLSRDIRLPEEHLIQTDPIQSDFPAIRLGRRNLPRRDILRQTQAQGGALHEAIQRGPDAVPAFDVQTDGDRDRAGARAASQHDARKTAGRVRHRPPAVGIPDINRVRISPARQVADQDVRYFFHSCFLVTTIRPPTDATLLRHLGVAFARTRPLNSPAAGRR